MARWHDPHTSINRKEGINIYIRNARARGANRPPRRCKEVDMETITIAECKNCGREFVTDRSHKVYCSDACRAEAKRRYCADYHRAYYAEHAETIRMQHRDYYRRYRKAILVKRKMRKAAMAHV